jgi:hypothetical protein
VRSLTYLLLIYFHVILSCKRGPALAAWWVGPRRAGQLGLAYGFNVP